MPAVLSKPFIRRLLNSDWSFGYNCYEVGHTWTPSCTEASLDVSLTAAIKVVPLYALMYGFSQVVIARKLTWHDTIETSKSIARSAFFIFFHAYTAISMGCTFRNLMGRFYYRVLVFLPAFSSSWLAIMIEHPARRQALAFYMLNMASEIAYRLLVNKRIITRTLPAGETLLFAISMAAWLYHVRIHGFGRDPTNLVLRLLLGPHEGRDAFKRVTQKATNSSNGEYEQKHQEQQQQDQHKLSNKFMEKGHMVTQWIHKIKAIVLDTFEPPHALVPGAHTSCAHGSRSSCLAYVLTPIPSRFFFGYFLQTALTVSSRPLQFFLRPSESIRLALMRRENVKLGLFIASMVSVTRLTFCSLRRYCDGTNIDHQQQQWHAFVAGFSGGLAMLWAPRSSLSMYLMWKVAELYYLKAAKQGKVKHVDLTFALVYSLSCSFVLYTFALEPKLIRAPFMKFIDKISDHRLHQLNRMVLDVFSPEASAGYKDYFPDLHPKLMSSNFKETIFNWMIQKYE